MDASVENRKYTTELAASAEAVAVAPSEPAPESRVPEPPEQLVGAPGPSTLPDALPDASHPVQLNTSLTETAINVTSLVEGARADEDRADIFALKPIKFFDQFTETYRTVKILLQNKFGPCAALSLCNCLALRGELKLEGEQMSYDTLAALLGDLLINKAEGGTVDGVADVLELLPTLRHGLDVDVKFGDVYGFDASPSLSIFKSFDVHLLHGWTVDPQDTDAWAGASLREICHFTFA